MATRSSADRERLKPPPLQTSLTYTSTRHENTAPPAQPRTSIDGERTYDARQSLELSAKGGYQNFVLTDPVAYRYLEEDSSTRVIDRRRSLHGYECYLVEQWATSRTHPTFMVTTYTGDSSHIVMVGVLSVPKDEEVWSPRLRVYFKALNQYHARRRQTDLGILMVTNLSNFPSSLTIIPVPGGDIRKHRFDFFVNENLKRLGCSGRAGLTLSPPATATVAKFHQLYRTSEKNDTYKSVLELVRLCQTALTLFDRLDVAYADGLLCDVTERAINDWWVEIGHEQYNVEPHDGILGPTTVAALLGLLVGARNRLHSVNAPVPKDPFDVESMKKGIGSFQKQQRIQRTRRLDRRTLERLHKATQRAAEKDRWAVPKAVKSTMAELSGKGGEMVMEAVGRRDRAGIAEIETVDIERFVQLASGDRAKWLWLGKPIKKHKTSGSHDKVTEDEQGETVLNQGLLFKPDDHGGFTWAAGRKSTVDGALPGKRERQRQEDEYDEFSRPTPAVTEDLDEEDEEDNRPSIFQRATTIKDEARSGFGKVKGAVGLRGHKSKPSTDDNDQVNSKGRRPLLRRAISSPVGSPGSPRADQREERAMPSVAEYSNTLNAAIVRDRSGTAESRSMIDPSEKHQLGLPAELKTKADQAPQERHETSDQEGSIVATATPSIAGSTYNGVDLNEALPAGPQRGLDAHSLLRRTLSHSQFVNIQIECRDNDYYPRHLSFSLAEDSILTWKSLIRNVDEPFNDDLRTKIAAEEQQAKQYLRVHEAIEGLRSHTAPWTSSQIHRLQQVVQFYDQNQEEIEPLHESHVRTVRELQISSEGIIREEKDRLNEGIKELEAAGAKLDYEIDALKSKVEDVAAAVTDFERGIIRVEERVTELEREGEKRGWSCALQ